MSYENWKSVCPSTNSDNSYITITSAFSADGTEPELISAGNSMFTAISGNAIPIKSINKSVSLFHLKCVKLLKAILYNRYKNTNIKVYNNNE
jgi:hypothetical protein